ncbi:MAG: tetratricopeptide repeat protein [Elusimicrobia bacterium]|nr:tetratricopeptide repeat protein [Elusimicrobiota bacterium]
MLATILLGLGQTLAPCWAADEFLKNMRKAAKVKEDPDKIEYYDRAISAWEPDDGGPLLAECRFRRGEAHFRRWEFSAAEPDLSKAIELDSGNSQARLLRGRVRLRAGRVPEALKDLFDFTIMAPENIEGFLWLGQAHLKIDEYEPALRSFSRAAQIDARDYRAPLGQGRVWLGRREWDKALASLSAADGLAKRRVPDVLTELAVCEVARGRHEAALDDYGRAIPLLEHALSQLSRADIPTVELADERETAARAYYGRGRVNEFLVRLPDALADYRQACELGHQESCRKAEGLAARSEETKQAKTRTLAKPERKAPAASKKKKLPPPDSEAGDRIYAN